MVFHGITISTKQTAIPTAGRRSRSTLLSLKPGQLKKISPSITGERRKKIPEMQPSLVKYVMPKSVSMVTVVSKEKKEVSLDTVGTDLWDCPYFNSHHC